jgi:hypothetical protein
MSLLDNGARYQPCIVYPEVMVIDGDGNKRTKPSDIGIPARARIQPIGTPTEAAEGGFHTISRYSLRFPHSFNKEHGVLGAQSQIEWKGKRYSMEGEALDYNGSRRTAHVDYLIVRR